MTSILRVGVTEKVRNGGTPNVTRVTYKRYVRGYGG
jgi:hypothetical protein